MTKGKGRVQGGPEGTTEDMSTVAQHSLLAEQDPGVKHVALVPESEPPDGLSGVIERLAANPSVDVDKLERIIALQERILHHNQKAAFDAAYSKMQADLPEVVERGKIQVKGQLRSTYAKLEDIHAAVKPTLKKHGFAIRHRTEWPESQAGTIRIVGILSHESGHSEESTFEAPMDRSEYRTDIQSMGSTVSYGRRYTTLDLLNIATRGADDDGASQGRPHPPEGYEDWKAKLALAAAGGMKAFEPAWECSDGDFAKFKTYMVNSDRAAWNELKATATGKAKK